MASIFSYESMGTHWSVSIFDEISPSQAASLEKAIREQSQQFDNTYSRFIKTSLVWEMAKTAGTYTVPEDFMNMLSVYRSLYLPSEKKVTPLIGFAISDLGYDAEYSLEKKTTVRSVPDLLTTVQIVDATHITLSEPVLFDFGALGKGYFVDQIATYLQKQGLHRYLVDGSGDIFYSGLSAPIRAGLEHPDDATKVIGVIEIEKGALCASAGNRRKWGNYSHTINPLTLTSPEAIIATWVTAPTAVIADALATCLFFCDPKNFTSFDFEYCILNKNYEVKRSTGFAVELF